MMKSPAPEPQPRGKAGAASPRGELQPVSGARAGRGPAEPPLPSVPDHELLRCIGRGAYGAVWLARNVMGTFRAVKLVHREDFARDRPFTREYEGLLNYEPISRSHPNLMQILHVGRHDSYFYYVTELADDASALKIAAVGPNQAEAPSPSLSNSDFELRTWDVFSYVPRTLQEDLERRGRLPVRECVALATALTSALKHLHGHSLVHRDVKPSNVIFVNGVPKLADIGLVATVGDSRSIVGTEGYLPPEGPGNPQADLFSLGRLLYEASTGLECREYPRLPANLAVLDDAQSLLEFNEVLLKACAKDTTRRYRQAEDLLADLALLERGDSVKRLRRLERHHKLLKRLGVAVLAIGLLVSATWWQTWRAHRIATRHLAQLHVNEGTRRMAEGDYAAALPWLVGALELDAGNSQLERVHRTRIASVLERCPVPVACFSDPASRVVTADLSPEGTVVATAHEDGSVRLWNTLSGKETRRLSHDYPVALCRFLPSGDQLLTVSMLQQACLWNLTKPSAPPVTFVQALGAGGSAYCLGLNESLNRAYLSKGRHLFARCQQPYTGPFSNVTMNLKLGGKGEDLLVRCEIRRRAPDYGVLYVDQFVDTPQPDAFYEGSDNPPGPAWGPVLFFLENPSFADSAGTPGEVVWDNFRVRRYPAGERPPDWQVVDDFSGDSLTNWICCTFADDGRSWRAVNGEFVLSCTNLPTYHSVSGTVLWRQPLEISRTHTLEVEVDLVSVQAPFRGAGLALGRYAFNPFSAPERPFVAHGRWLAATFWDAPIRIWDLEKAENGKQKAEVELNAVGEVQDLDFSPDTNLVAAVCRPNLLLPGTASLRVWSFRTGSEVPLNRKYREGATDARFSPDSRFLAVCRGNELLLLRTQDWQIAQTLAKGVAFSYPRFSPMGTRLAAVKDQRQLVVWDLGELPEPWAIFPHQSDINRFAFSPDGRLLASSCANGMVHVWDVPRAERLGPPVEGMLVSFSPDGARLLLVGQEGGAWLWDLSRVVDHTLSVPPFLAEQTVVSSSNKAITAEIQSTEIVLRMPTGNRSLFHPAPLRRVTFTPDARSLVAEDSDLRAWMWDLRTYTLLQPPARLSYQAAMNTLPSPSLQVDTRSPSFLKDLAALLSNQRPDGYGGMEPMAEVERQRVFLRLKEAHHAEFDTDPAIRSRWHREQAEASELSMDCEAAVFHWERAGGSTGTGAAPEIPLELRLAYARAAANKVKQALLNDHSRWSVILDRPPWATPGMLDLSSFYTRSLGVPQLAGRPGTAFRALAPGVQQLGGTAFDVRGVIDLKHAKRLEIPVGRPAKHLHFLHAATPPISNREKAGRYELTFSGGASLGLDLLNPDDVPPITPHRFHEIAAHSRTNANSGLRASLAWSGCIPGSTPQKEMLYLTRTTWDLPASYDGQVIESIRLQAGPSQSAPLIFAITVE